MSRNTNTGGVLEAMIVHALKRGGYSHSNQETIGIRLGGKGRHKVDTVAEKDGVKILVSMKWQQTGGTAEQKVPYEVMCLAEAIEDNKGKYSHAFVVLGGDGWKLRDFYVSGGLSKYMKNTDKVKVLTLEQFVAEANKGKL